MFNFSPKRKEHALSVITLNLKGHSGCSKSLIYKYMHAMYAWQLSLLASELEGVTRMTMLRSTLISVGTDTVPLVRVTHAFTELPSTAVTALGSILKVAACMRGEDQ